jgi:sporulation protein YhbH
MILENIRRNAREGQGAKFGNIKKDDLRFKTWEEVMRYESNAVVIAMIDVSGSMGEFKKYVARSFYFWMVRFLRTKYDNVDIVFISHHTEAKEVSEEQFFTQGESGGTVVSSAYQLALDVIKLRYRPSDWNIYPFHFSDGDNYYSDNEEAVRLADELITTCNLFGYGEIGEEGSSSYRRSSGALLSIFNDRLKNKDHFVGVRIDDKEDVYPALKQFFGQRGIETPA